MKHDKQPLKRSKKLVPIDGIISDGRRLGEAPVKNDDMALGRSAGRPDGFHPLRQSPGGLGHIAMEPTEPNQPETAQANETDDEPIVIDHNPKKRAKKHFWRRLHRPRGRTVLKWSLITLLVLIIAGGSIFGYKLYKTQKHVLAGGGYAPAVCDGDVPLSNLTNEGDSRINILLLGIGGPGHDGPNLSDTIMLVSLDPVNFKADLISIPRDLWVNIPGYGSNKINHAYAFGVENIAAADEKAHVQNGWKLVHDSLEPVIGVPIHYYATVNFKAFKDIVNAIGGIDVNVPTQLYDPTVAWENHWNPVIAKAGQQKMSGQTALLYAKSRETSPRGDFDRAERQRLLIESIRTKVQSAGTYSNPLAIIKLMDGVGSNVVTNFNRSDINCLYKEGSKISNDQIKSLDMVTPPHQLLTTGSYAGQSVVKPQAGLYSYTAINDYVRQTLRDSFLARENAAVAVYNATGQAGLATTKADRLKIYGYRVTTVANAGSSTAATTTIVDLTKGHDKYTRHYLENRFHVKATDKVPSAAGITAPADTDFVIILGKDAQATTSSTTSQ